MMQILAFCIPLSLKTLRSIECSCNVEQHFSQNKSESFLPVELLRCCLPAKENFVGITWNMKTMKRKRGEKSSIESFIVERMMINDCHEFTIIDSWLPQESAFASHKAYRHRAGAKTHKKEFNKKSFFIFPSLRFLCFFFFFFSLLPSMGFSWAVRSQSGFWDSFHSLLEPGRRRKKAIY